MYKNNFKNQSAFTLVEMLVSIAVFMSVMTVAVSSLISIINVNRKTQEIKSVVDNVTFAIDTISRNVRIGTKYSCSTNVGGTYIGDYSADDKCKNFQYRKSSAEYVQYQFVASPATGEGNIQRRICSGDNSGCPTTWQSMTAPTDIVKITNMTFYVIGAGTESLPAAQRKQPRLIITVEGVIVESNGTKTSFSLQTTASQRSRQSNG
jgi:type II secretory pathway pseudopilin PulG